MIKLPFIGMWQVFMMHWPLQMITKPFHQMTESDYASAQRHACTRSTEHLATLLTTWNSHDDDKYEFSATSCRQCTGATESPDLARQEARPWLQTDMRGMWQPPPLPQPILTLAIYGSWWDGDRGGGGVHAAKYKRLKLGGNQADDHSSDY